MSSRLGVSIRSDSTPGRARTASHAARSRARTSQWACRGASAASISSSGRFAGGASGWSRLVNVSDQQEGPRPQLVERLGQDQLARVQQGHVAGHALDLADLVAREQDRPARAGEVDHALEELAADHRVQARGRLVEDQERRVGGQRQGQRDLGLHPLRQGLDLPLGGQAEPVGQLGVARLVGRGARPGVGVEARRRTSRSRPRSSSRRGPGLSGT